MTNYFGPPFDWPGEFASRSLEAKDALYEPGSQPVSVRAASEPGMLACFMLLVQSHGKWLQDIDFAACRTLQ